MTWWESIGRLQTNNCTFMGSYKNNSGIGLLPKEKRLKGASLIFTKNILCTSAWKGPDVWWYIARPLTEGIHDRWSATCWYIVRYTMAKVFPVRWEPSTRQVQLFRVTECTWFGRLRHVLLHWFIHSLQLPGATPYAPARASRSSPFFKLKFITQVQLIGGKIIKILIF